MNSQKGYDAQARLRQLSSFRPGKNSMTQALTGRYTPSPSLRVRLWSVCGGKRSPLTPSLRAQRSNLYLACGFTAGLRSIVNPKSPRLTVAPSYRPTVSPSHRRPVAPSYRLTVSLIHPPNRRPQPAPYRTMGGGEVAYLPSHFTIT